MRWLTHAHERPAEAPPAREPSESTEARAAHASALRWAGEARVVVREVADADGLREVSSLLLSTWGRSAAGVPLSTEILVSLAHAGGLVLAAYDGPRLVGAAALTPSGRPQEAYGLVAAVVPDLADRGIGLALKQAQRAWALAHGFATLTWTFDPLVGRNARFNLVKLGAEATSYAVDFYGPDEAGEPTDRLVAAWSLTAPRTVAGAEGRWHHQEPSLGVDRQVLAGGPDHEVMACHELGRTWVRVPRDIVGVRRDDPAAAAAWRLAVRAQLEPVLARGGRVVHITKDSWYVVEEPAARRA